MKLPFSTSVHLDFLRGLASILVVAGHLRYLFFPPFESLEHPGLFLTFFYYLSSFGHIAVIVFFVLSGFWIAASVSRGPLVEFSIVHFAARRLSRLYIVVIPGLLLTAILDYAGMNIPRTAPFYYAPMEQFYGFVIAEQYGWNGFIGTLLFLQGIRSSIFGSNSALWSLTYEFWYYAVFGALLVLFFRKKILPKLLSAAFLLWAYNYIFHNLILARFAIWLLGVLALVLSTRSWILGRKSLGLRLISLFSLGIFAIRPLYPRIGEFNADFITGFFTWALVLGLIMLDNQTLPAAYTRFARLIAGFSFSLYVVHLPILVFIRALISPIEKFSPSLPNLIVATFIFLFTIACGHLFSLATEANTKRLRNRMKSITQ
ncbi:MAG: acyltransferase family protein [Bacteriovoracia bacterium]